MKKAGFGRRSAAAIILIVPFCLQSRPALAWGTLEPLRPEATLGRSQVTVNPNGSVTYRLFGSSFVNGQTFSFLCTGSYDPASHKATEVLTEDNGNEIQSNSSCLSDPWQDSIACSNASISSKGYDSGAAAYISNLMAPISAQALTPDAHKTLKVQFEAAQAAARAKVPLTSKSGRMAVLPTPTRAVEGRFAMGAGNAKLGDELVAAHAPTSMTIYPPYGAVYTGGAPPTTMKAGQVAMVPINVQNTSSQTWPAGGNFHLSFHWYRGGVQIVRDGDRTFMTAAVRSGATISLMAKVTAPPTAGAATLQWDMVQEGVAWFSDKGAPMSPPKNVNVTP